MDEKLEKYIRSVALSAGDRIGTLKVLRYIGSGPNAIVYEANDESTQRIIVIKEYFPVRLAKRNSDQTVEPRTAAEAADFNSGRETFLHSGMKLSQIRHPNIVQLLKVEEHNKTVYMLMEKVEGQLLSNLIGSQSFIPPETITEWIKKILDATNHIHENNLLHLAIDPENIIINDRLGPVLIDFGNSPSQQEVQTTESVNPYKAIELTAENQSEIGKHSDIYSVGAMLAHLLTGNAPVPASSRAKAKTDPQVRLTGDKNLTKYYSKSLLSAIDRALAILPNNRFSSIEEWQLETSDATNKSQKNKSILIYGLVGIVIFSLGFWMIAGRSIYVEYQTWNAVNQETPCSVNTYLEKYPLGKYQSQAEVLLDTCIQQTKTYQLAQIEILVGPMARIAGSCFEMGSDIDQVGRQHTERLHSSCVDSFDMSIFEVTVEKFEKFVKDKNYKTDAESNKDDPGCWSLSTSDEDPWSYKQWASWRSPYKDFEIRDDFPVSCVSAHDIDNYLAWLNDTIGVDFRLPTEAEWEYATKGKSNWARPWGDNSDDACQYANVADSFNDPKISGVSGSKSPWPSGHRCNDGNIYATSVGQYQPNHNGLYDLIGNLWEITCSSYSGSYGGLEAECGDGENSRTDKGGGWQSTPNEARSSVRGEVGYFDRASNIGFRLIKEDHRTSQD